MVFKMRRNNIRPHIVCRMLDRRKRIDFLPHWEHDDAARMLPGRTPDADTALHNPVNFTKTLMNAALLVIALDIAKRGFICQCTDRARPKRLPGAENNLGILVRLTLVITGKIEVNIRLLVSFKS